ncbi:hypothetical protein B0H11DRAFT_1245370 [Mycena galericulata]|nr:hypothetical protein B0H11DRAFT_1245370 [Mycena galericulata]
MGMGTPPGGRRDEFGGARRESFGGGRPDSFTGSRPASRGGGSFPPRAPLAARPRPPDPDDDGDDDGGDGGDEFVPTLARRSITGSASSTSAQGAGSPGRHTTPLPLPGASGSPGRYTSAFHAPAHPRQRSESATHSPSPSAYAYARAQQEYSYAPSSSRPPPQQQQQEPASYRMGVHVAAGSPGGFRRDLGGADVVDRFVLPRSGGSAASSVPSVPPSGYERERGESSVGLTGVGGARTGGREPASEREREREREKGVPIGGVAGPSAFGGGGVGSLGTGQGGGPGSLGATSGSGSGLSGPSAIAINPFKSNTLSRSALSSSLLRMGGVAGSPGRTASPIAAAGGVGAGVAFPQPSLSSVDSGSLSGGSVGAGPGPGGAGVGIPVRKRYSSSFPHRYGGAAAGSSAGSGGSGESGSGSGSLGLAARERTSSFLKTPPGVDEQHDDISLFVKDIDAARPLLGRYRQEQQQEKKEDEPSASGSGSSSPGTSREGTVRASTSSAGTALGGRTMTPAAFDAPPPPSAHGSALVPRPAMLTSESEVDERLRRMNEEFVRSLVGLGGGGRGASATSSASASGMISSPVSAGSSSRGDGQGSEEVIGRLEFDFEGQGR